MKCVNYDGRDSVSTTRNDYKESNSLSVPMTGLVSGPCTFPKSTQMNMLTGFRDFQKCVRNAHW